MSNVFETDFEKLPQEMKDATLRLKAAITRERKARKQSRLWDEELSIASKMLEIENKSYGTVSMRWNPEDNSIAPMEEIDSNFESEKF